MCRSCDESGRRCPGEADEDRRNRQRAEYAAGVAPDLASMTDTPSPDESPEAPLTVEDVAARAAALRERIAAGDGDWQDLERETTRLGAQVAALARAEDPTAFPDSPADPDAAWAEVDRARDAFADADAAVTSYVVEQGYEDAFAAAHDPEWRRLSLERGKAKSAWTDASARAVGGGDRQEDVERRAEAYRKVLGAVRPMGGDVQAEESTFAKGGMPVLAEQMHNFPSEWIEASNAIGSLTVLESYDRNHYTPDVATRFHADGDDGVDATYMPHDWKPEPDDPKFEGWAAATSPGVNAKGERVRMWYGPARDVRYLRPTPGYEDMPPDPNAEWVKHSQVDDVRPDGTPIVKVAWVRPRPGAYTVEIESQITVSDPSSASHEFSHRCEHSNQRIGELTEAFVTRRTTNADGVRDELIPYAVGGAGEVVRPDGFVDVYMGKDYGESGLGRHTYHEVLSMGVEAIFHGQYGSLEGLKGYKEDRGTRDFVVGLLAAA